MQNFFEHRLNIGKYQTAVFFCFAALLFSCNSAPKAKVLSSNPEIIGIEKLNSIDTAVWAFHKTWNLNDTTVVVMAKSKYFDDCHMCGPDLSLILLTQEKSSGKWTVKKTKMYIPIGTSWGSVPDIEFINNSHGQFLAVDWGYGNQGCETSYIKFFNLEEYNFGNLMFIYHYTSAEEASADKKILSKYAPKIIASDTSWYYTYKQELNYQLDSNTGNIIIYSVEHSINFYDYNSANENYKYQYKLPSIKEIFVPIGSGWGKAYSPMD